MPKIKFQELRYISNILSLMRMVLLLPIYYFMQLNTTSGNYWAVFVMLVAAATDALDGKLARKLKQKSDLGRILDPLADKIGVTIMAILLVKLRGLPLWFLIFAVARDAVILLAGLVLAVRSKLVVESNMIGKITVNSLGMLIISYTLRFDPLRSFFLWLSVLLLVVSSISYAIKLVKILRARSDVPVT